MSQGSAIEWTEATWNPVTGCTKVSPGCKHCYAERMARRLKAMGQSRYRDGFAVTLQPDVVELPTRWKKPRVIFVNSMSDLFHDSVPDQFILDCFSVMNRTPRHTYQVLTKRPERLSEMSSRIDWTENIWIGTSIESSDYTWRAKQLVTVPASIRFLSVEPLLGAIPRLPLTNIDWVIVGGESGPGAREMAPAWVRQIRDRCVARGVPFFFKQWGGVHKSKTGRVLDGRKWDEMPEFHRGLQDGQEEGESLERTLRKREGRRRSAHAPVGAVGQGEALLLEPLH
ncbi:MAG: phage Gp37/Gp68 family protein [Planctomycetota bacterium]|nr:MAG: phage Gp37/Gp68 family protein [Planctomycetota bacterium]